MILAIDAGNSNIVLGTVEEGTVRNVVQIHTEPKNTAAEYGIKIRQLLDYYGIDPGCLEGVIISSVVPSVTEALREALEKLCGTDCMVVGPGIKTGLNVRIDDPGSLAGSLVVGSVAAITFYSAPAIILDLGTATTMVVVDGGGTYRGGAIIPGVELGLQALSSRTSLLPEVSVSAPKRVIATNTVDAMRSGAVYATASMIDGMIERMEQELGESCCVVATGSLAEMIASHCRREIICDRDLILKGLWALYRKNRRS